MESFESDFTNNTLCQSFALASRNDPGAVILNSRRERPVRSFDRKGGDGIRASPSSRTDGDCQVGISADVRGNALLWSHCRRRQVLAWME